MSTSQVPDLADRGPHLILAVTRGSFSLTHSCCHLTPRVCLAALVPARFTSLSFNWSIISRTSTDPLLVSWLGPWSCSSPVCFEIVPSRQCSSSWVSASVGWGRVYCWESVRNLLPLLNRNQPHPNSYLGDWVNQHQTYLWLILTQLHEESYHNHT